jgi:hypothetical protein
MSAASELGLDGPWSGAHRLVYRTGKLLVVTGPGWTAEAAWERRDGEWRCTAATPPVDWMMRMGSEAAVLEMDRRGLSHRWL